MSDVNNAAETIDGNHLVVEALKMNGVSTIYGLVGIPITDLARLAQARGIRFIGFRNEQAAGHAAAAAGYLTQRPGICLTVSAPGFLNGLVALANATTNCFPMILISGSSEREIIDLKQGDYEELDQLEAARPYAKASFRVDKPELIGVGVVRAFFGRRFPAVPAGCTSICRGSFSTTRSKRRPARRRCLRSRLRLLARSPARSPLRMRSKCSRGPSVR